MMHEKQLVFTLSRKLFYIVFIVIASFLVFSNVYKNDFHLDDANSLIGNACIRTINPVSRFFTDVSVLSNYAPNRQFRPFLPLSFSINYAIGGYDPSGYHLLNLIFNVISAVLLFFILLEIQAQVFPSGDMARHTDVAFASALMFAVHPVTGITVNYISNRDLVMMQMFLSASMLVYVRMRSAGETVPGYAAVFILLVCSILSKTNPVVMPLLILVYEYVIRKEKIMKTGTLLRVAVFAVPVALFFIYSKFVLEFSDIGNLVVFNKGSLLTYFPTQAKQHLFVYLANFFYPFNIHIEPAVGNIAITNPMAIAGVVFIAASIVAAFKIRKKNPLISFCILAYWIMMLPESSFLPFDEWRVDYRPFTASPYLYFLGATAAFQYLKTKPRSILFIAFLAYFSISSYFLNRVWLTDHSLWSYSVKKGGNALAYTNLAMATPDVYERKKYYEDALEISPYYVFPNINYGLLLISIGAKEKGINYIKGAIDMDPSNPIIHYWLAKGYQMAGMNKEAFEEAGIASHMDPKSLESAYLAALLAQANGDYARSLEYTGAVMKMSPDYEDTCFIHGFGLQKTERTEECIPVYLKCLARNSRHSQGWFNLGYAYKETGRFKQSAECFNKVLDINPDYDEARLHLVFCYNKLNDPLYEDFENLARTNK